MLLSLLIHICLINGIDFIRKDSKTYEKFLLEVDYGYLYFDILKLCKYYLKKNLNRLIKLFYEIILYIYFWLLLLYIYIFIY